MVGACCGGTGDGSHWIVPVGCRPAGRCSPRTSAKGPQLPGRRCGNRGGAASGGVPERGRRVDSAQSAHPATAGSGASGSTQPNCAAVGCLAARRGIGRQPGCPRHCWQFEGLRPACSQVHHTGFAAYRNREARRCADVVVRAAAYTRTAQRIGGTLLPACITGQPQHSHRVASADGPRCFAGACGERRGLCATGTGR